MSYTEKMTVKHLVKKKISQQQSREVKSAERVTLYSILLFFVHWLLIGMFHWYNLSIPFTLGDVLSTTMPYMSAAEWWCLVSVYHGLGFGVLYIYRLVAFS
jgi:hypothetical protein